MTYSLPSTSSILALFTGYTVYRYKFHEAFMAGSDKLDLVLGGVNTVVLIVSSLTMALAVHARKRTSESN